MPRFVLPLQSTVINYAHSMEGSTLTLCVSASLAAQLFFDGASWWEYVQREAEMRRLYLPAATPDVRLDLLPRGENPEGMFGEVVRVTCAWARAGEAQRG